MNVSHKHKFVWSAPPKVGSRTIKEIFRKHCDLNPQWPSDDHPSDFSHVNLWPDGVPDDYLHITTVRHPYYRWISYWKYAQNDENELKRVDTDPLTALLEMEDSWFNAWSCHRIATHTNPRIDYIIHAETLVSDVRNLPFMPDNYELDVKSLGITSAPPGYLWDDQQLRNAVYERFEIDYYYFGYGKDDVIDIWNSNPIRASKQFPTKL